MLIVQLDEPTLFVYPSLQEAERSIEGVDAEQELRAAYDEHGVPYRIEMLTPNIRSSFMGLETVGSGTFSFQPAGPASPDLLAKLIEESLPAVEPPEAAGKLREILARLRVA